MTQPADGPTPPSPTRQPGEALPAERRLARPPGDRYRQPAPEPVLERPDMGRGLAWGLLVGGGTAILLGIVHAVLSNAFGQLAVPILGGWLVGWAVRRGAWRGRLHRPSAAPVALAAGLGVATWAAGLLLAWLLSQAILPGSARSFPDRLAATPFLDWLAPQLSLMDAVRLALLVVGAALGARSRGQEPPRTSAG